jgi:putative SOS response-associated peptidase YedK
MCGRFVAHADAALEREFGLVRSDWGRFQRYNVAPTQPVPVVVHGNEGREGRLMRWGLVPWFARGEAGPYSTINARVETLRTSAAFRGAWQRGQRCLVIAQGFYEWQQLPGAGTRKQPWYIQCADQPVFAFAGLWDRSTPPGGEAIESCTIITLPASPFMAEVHNSRQREPAILRREDHDTWLSGTPDAAFACLHSYDDALRSAWPVSAQVNSPRHDGPELIAALSAAQG